MIRLAVESDLKQITDMTVKVKKIMHEIDKIPQWDYNYPMLEDFARDVEEQTMYVYIIDNQVVGYIVLNDDESEKSCDINYRDYEKYLVIHRFAVNPEYRGQQVGVKLANYVIDVAREKGCEAVRIDTNSVNEKMNSLIVKLGFELRGQMELRENRPLWNAYDKIINN